jgi:DNA-directed RNA polymerase specialized sigma24 family protein
LSEQLLELKEEWMPDRSETVGQAFELLLAWLNPDKERAAAEYVRLHQRFSKMFESRGCATPEDYADETFNRVGRQLLERKEIRTDNSVAYLDGVARFVLREQWHAPPREDIDEVAPDRLRQNESGELAELAEKERRQVCLDKCLDELPAESRALILEYYAEDKTLKIDTRAGIAERLGVAAGVLRNRIFKLRNALRGCVALCLAC